MKKILKLFCIALYCVSCCPINAIIEEKYPIGSKLSSELLSNARQIIPYNDQYMILINETKQGEIDYNPYLLIFDENLLLKYIENPPMLTIDCVRNDTIFGRNNEYSANNQCNLTHKMPFTIQLSSTFDRTVRSYKQLVDSILISEGNYAIIYYSVYDGFVNDENISDSLFLAEQFIKNDSAVFEVGNIIFERDPYYLSIRNYSDSHKTNYLDVYFIGKKRYKAVLKEFIENLIAKRR
jgi:hypothetical protein